MVENMVDDIKERYKLKEAAKIIAQNNIADTNKILNKLERAVRDGSLQVFQTGSNVHYEIGADKESGEIKESDLLRSDVDVLNGGFTWVDREYDGRLREALYQLPDNLEVYWNDLNTWLTENEPQLNYKFQNPGTSAAKQTKSQASDSLEAETHKPITNWIMRIQAEAASRWCIQKKLGCSPTRHSMKKELAQWCRDNNVMTDGGIFPSEGYIYRHVTRKWDPPKC